jgi:D-3-phosphoglycerate dehydrogenase|tara:strand:- start:329 stop:1306 length:978 start_codon:yes stop_codon:yes gene_type:complete
MKNQNHSSNLPASDLLIAVASSSFSKSAFLRKKLEEVFSNIIFNERGHPLPDVELAEFLKNADAAIVGIDPITDQVLSRTPQLKIISKYGVGLDNIDLPSLKRRNIALGWTGGVNRRSVSELTLCFMLGLCRNVFGTGYKLKQGQWEKEGGQQLSEKTIGIIGCGHIGSDLIQLLAPFKCNLLVNDIIDKSEFCRAHNAEQTSLENLIVESDLISLHVPLTSRTIKMADKNFLNRMKSTAYLINTSRGDVVGQDALKKSLLQGDIAGAALDVFMEEPPTDEEFLSSPNLMVTPHIGGNARESVEAMGRAAIQHLVSFFRNLQARD